jgi:dGTPase
VAAEPAAVRGLDRGAHLNGSWPARFDYRPSDAARWLAEQPKRDQYRTPARGAFERDRARVLHSYAFRRLADKTQVVSPGQDDFPRTRLTHSLEVAQIGRELAAMLGCDPDIVDAAGLAHDLGHPPFGHNGESALNAVALAGGCDGFEGNAQTLRILTRLEAKAVTGQPAHPVGLNLTRASLDAVCKYPWPSGSALSDQGKFGAYAADLPAFRWLREGRPDGARCLEAQVMDWADDVAYSVHDVEDGILVGRISLDTLGDPIERALLAELAAKHFSVLLSAELEAAAVNLLALPVLDALRHYDGSLAAQVALKDLTSELVGRYVAAVVSATVVQFGHGPLGRYRADLVIPSQVAAEVALLKAMALRFVMSNPHRLALQAGQRDMLAELCAALVQRAPHPLDPALALAWRRARDDSARLRVVIDQVSALTDAQAVRWHAALLPHNS